MFSNTLFITTALTCGFLLRVASSTEQEDQNGDWEYVPRIWSVEDSDISLDESSLDYGFDNLEPDIVPVQPTEDPHDENYYFVPEPVVKQANDISNKAGECNQFRVDIQEAVICDKSRCDKLNFKWPSYSNQLRVIETTKHGMRFHQTDYAFARIPKRYNYEIPLNSNQTDRVKFDLFELFKPSSTTTTTTTTAASTTQETTTSSSQDDETTTAAPSDDETTTTSDESETTTTEASTETTTTADTAETTTAAPAEDGRVSTNGLPGDGPRLISTLRLDTRRKKQTMLGFGGALSDATCRNIKSLSPSMSKSLMEDYFGERGLKYSIVRMSIGSSDFSITPYTNNDRNDTLKLAIDPRDDVEMDNFHLTPEDYEFKLPIARQAIATSKRELKFFASLWSPPIWMKNNTNIVHGYLKGDIYGPYYKAMAELMLKWLEAYRRNGLEFWGITGQNEPITGTREFIHHNSLGISKEDYITFYKLYLGPMMKRRGFQDTKIMILDDNKGYVPFWVKSFLEDKEAAKYIDGVAIHWYMSDDFENLNYISKHHPDKFILSTEACNGYVGYQTHVLPGDWDRGVAYMLDIIKLIQKNSAGWVDWNMALDLSGGPSWVRNFVDAPVIVNAARDEYYKSPMFYAMGHFSHFVEPGSVRLDHRLANAKYDYPVETVAFQTPNEYVVIVALNANKHPVPLRVIVDKQLVRIVTLKADSYSSIVFKWKSKVNQKLNSN